MIFCSDRGCSLWASHVLTDHRGDEVRPLCDRHLLELGPYVDSFEIDSDYIRFHAERERLRAVAEVLES